jgi:TetR/AcrR family transcriptional regulator, transcriptional repressor for nem operon
MSSDSPEAARECILDAAYAEINRNGFQSAGISAILAETGLTKGALYHYFPSKKALGLAVVDERVGRSMRHGVLAALVADDAEARPLDRLLAVLDDLRANPPVDFIRLGCPLNNLIQEMSGIDEDFRRHLMAPLLEWQRSIETLLRQAQRQGQIAAGTNCEAAASFIVSAWEGCLSIAKNLQSVDVFAASIGELRRYVTQLQVS